MRSVRCIILILSGLGVVSPQTTIRSAEPEPFRIRAGSSFAASASSSSRNAANAARDRARIMEDLREAEAIISSNYAGGRTPSVSDLTSGALRSALHALDPHSNYYGSSEWKEMLDEQQSGYAGIGISIESYREKDASFTYVLGTFAGSPARRAGLGFGDKIVAVDGVSVVGSDTGTVSNRIRGTVGTNVRLTIERNRTGRIETLDLRRTLVSQPSIPDHYIIRDGVGYIALTEGFNFTTSDEFSSALADLHRSGMTSLVIDLRGNGGGIVDQAVKVAEKFLPAGTLIVSQRGRTAAETFEWRSSELRPETLPLVLLVDENTASASEIVAGALQDTDRAMIVGQRTFGKGLVQSVIDLPQKTGLTLTAARYFTPSGRSIQREYADLGRYDYYSRRGTASAIDTPYFEALTLTGRRVKGGDGIEPDEVVGSESTTNSQASLIDPVFLFVRDLMGGRIPGFLSPAKQVSAGRGKQVELSDLPISDALVDQFSEFVKKGSSDISAETVRAESQFIKTRLRYDIAMAMFDTMTATQVFMHQDRDVAAALDVLPRAGQLAVQARKYSK